MNTPDNDEHDTAASQRRRPQRLADAVLQNRREVATLPGTCIPVSQPLAQARAAEACQSYSRPPQKSLHAPAVAVRHPLRWLRQPSATRRPGDRALCALYPAASAAPSSASARIRPSVARLLSSSVLIFFPAYGQWWSCATVNTLSSSLLSRISAASSSIDAIVRSSSLSLIRFFRSLGSLAPPTAVRECPLVAPPAKTPGQACSYSPIGERSDAPAGYPARFAVHAADAVQLVPYTLHREGLGDMEVQVPMGSGRAATVADRSRLYVDLGARPVAQLANLHPLGSDFSLAVSGCPPVLSWR